MVLHGGVVNVESLEILHRRDLELLQNPEVLEVGCSAPDGEGIRETHHSQGRGPQALAEGEAEVAVVGHQLLFFIDSQRFNHL